MSAFNNGKQWGMFLSEFLGEDTPQQDAYRTIILSDVVSVIDDHLQDGDPLAETLREVIVEKWSELLGGDDK